jgi:collagen type III alpha
MSTTLDGRKAKKNYAEFDEYISYQLQQTQTGIRSTDIFTALCGAAVFVVSYLLAFVMFDHWVVAGGFGPGMRMILLSGLLVGTLAWIGWKVVWPFFRRVNSLYAANALEQASPELKSTLINYVDLRSADREVSPAIIGSMEKRAAVTLSHADVDDAIDRSTLLRLSYALLVAVVLLSVYSVVSPKQVWPSIVRIFAPGSEVTVSTQTAFLNVDPGDTQILARGFLTVTADLSGEVPEEVSLLYTTADEQFVDESVPMREVEAGLKRYRCILKGDAGEGLLQGLSYRIVAGDASTRTYNVTVAQPPSATVSELRYSFPDYMELPPERPTGSDIDTWEGTRIEIEASANMPVELAWVQFSDEPEFPDRCEEIRMEIAKNGTGLTALWQPIIRVDRNYPRFYRIQCKARGGATDPTPAVHTIRINPDEKPEVSTIQPNGDLEVAANAIVPLLIQASDSDFRLSRMVLRMRNGARPPTDRPLYTGDNTQKRIAYDLKIADLYAKPGDVITWWVEAHDNRLVETPTRTLLDANRSPTPELQFIVRAPISEEEVKKQLEQDKQRAQEKLDELDQQLGNDDPSSDEPETASPDQQPDAKTDEPQDGDDPPRKQDGPKETDPAPDEPKSDGDDGGNGGKSGSDSKSGKDGEDENNSDDKTGKSDEDRSKTESENSGEDGTGSKSEADQSKPDGTQPDGSKSESGPRKPVSNDGSQDDEILKELLKQNRDSKTDGEDGSDGDTGEKEEGGKDVPRENDPDGGTSESPKDSGDATTDDASDENPDLPKPETGDTTSKPGSPPDDKQPQKDGLDGKNPNEPGKNSPDKPADQDPAKGNPPEPGNDPPKSDQGEDSNNNPKKDGTGEKPSESDNTQPDDSGDKPGDKKPGDTEGGTETGDKPDSATGEKPTGKDPGKGDSDSKSDPSGKGDPPGKSDPPGKGDPPGKDNQPGEGDQPETPGEGGTPGKGKTGSKPSPSSDDAASKPSPAGKSGKGESGNDPAGKPPGGGTPKPSPKGGDDSESTSKKPGQPSADKPTGDKPADANSKTKGEPGKDSGSESDSKPGQKKPSSGETGRKKSAGSQKPGDAKDGKPIGGDPSGKPGGKPGSGKPGGGKPDDGASGSGQSAEPDGNPGQGTGGAKPEAGSNSAGNPIERPDDNADPNGAVQRDKSGANAHDPNLLDADKTNLEDKLKASNMVLKRLQKDLDRGEVDPELLKKLGWTEKDMQRFAERLERQLAQPKPDDPGAEARRRQFEEVLRSVDLESTGRQQDGNFNDQKSTNNFSDRRLPPPRKHRKAYEDYIKRLSKQRRGISSGK